MTHKLNKEFTATLRKGPRELKEYAAFEQAHAAVLRGGHALYPTATAATVRVPDGKGGEPIVSDGPYAVFVADSFV